MADRPNIVWITLDSVRQDHTTMGGHERNTTPRIDELGDRHDGVTFNSCFSHGIWTLASSASILTGTYPSHNTVGMGGEALPPEIPTVPELLGEIGYHTACLSRNSYLSPGTGLDRGFDRFEWIDSSRLFSAAGIRTTVKYLANLRRHSAGFRTDTAKHATPFVVNDIAKRWLRSYVGAREPFFLYLHYNEPHRPFYPPNKALDRFADDLTQSPRKAAEFALDVHRTNFEHIANGCDFSADEWSALEVMYDSEIAYTDECIGRLIETIEQLDLDDTIIVVTADHGEFLGEMGLLSHNYSVHDAVIHVPCVVAGVPGVDGAEDELVQHVDVMQTILEVAGADTSALQGIDIRRNTREFAISQRGPEDFEEVLKFDPNFSLDRFHRAAITALRTDEYKLVWSSEGSDLHRLPNEQTDVSANRSDVRERLEVQLREWLERQGQPATSSREAEFTNGMREQLSDLGYLT